MQQTVTAHRQSSSVEQKTVLSTMCELTLEETESVLQGGNSRSNVDNDQANRAQSLLRGVGFEQLVNHYHSILCWEVFPLKHLIDL